MEKKETKKETLLFVDDEEVILDITQEYFQSKNYNVLTAVNGLEAITVLENNKIDCCFTDIDMPEMDGIALSEHIWKIDNTIPVIIMTGYPSLNNTIKTLKNGVVDFLIKPVNLSQMEICVRRVMRERKLFVKNILLTKEVEGKERLVKLNQELIDKVEELGIINRIQNDFNKIHVGDLIFKKIVDQSLEIAPAEEAHLYMINDSMETPVKIATTQSSTRITAPNELIREVARDKISLLIHENKDQKRLDRSIHSFILLPLLIRGKIFGVLTTSIMHKQKKFTEKHLYYLSVMINTAASAIENIALYESIYENLFSTLYAFVKTIEAKDTYTKQHSNRVADIAVAIGKIMECSSEDIDILDVGGRLHDMGKIGIKDKILLKPGVLTRDEFKVIQRHPTIGADIISQVSMWNREQQIIRYHHERFDGTGYPDGLKGNNIPFLARILSVADVYDAMASDRLYRKRMPTEEVLTFIQKGAGSQFDPAMVEAFFEACHNGSIPLQ